MQEDPLVAAFEQDHRVLTRGLRDLRGLVVDGDWAAAAKRAAEMDAEVGAHIEFEERSFYPMLRRNLGAEFVGQLYREHEEGRQALKEILSLAAGEVPTAQQEAKVLEQLDIAISHALSCGTLVSHLENLDLAKRTEMLAALERSHEQGHSWTSRGR